VLIYVTTTNCSVGGIAGQKKAKLLAAVDHDIAWRDRTLSPAPPPGPKSTRLAWQPTMRIAGRCTAIAAAARGRVLGQTDGRTDGHVTVSTRLRGPRNNFRKAVNKKLGKLAGLFFASPQCAADTD